MHPTTVFFFASKEELQYIYVVGQSEYYSHVLEAAESQFTSSKHFSVVRVSCLIKKNMTIFESYHRVCWCQNRVIE